MVASKDFLAVVQEPQVRQKAEAAILEQLQESNGRRSPFLLALRSAQHRVHAFCFRYHLGRISFNLLMLAWVLHRAAVWQENAFRRCLKYALRMIRSGDCLGAWRYLENLAQGYANSEMTRPYAVRIWRISAAFKAKQAAQ